MKPAKPARKPNSGAPGVKLLITTASLAATLGGWALISGNEVKPAPAPTLMPERAAAPVVTASVVTIKLAPLPTLVPPVTPQPRLVTVNQPRAAAAARPAAAAPQPAPAPASVIVLRDVSAPALPDRSAPGPVVNTRSSR